MRHPHRSHQLYSSHVCPPFLKTSRPYIISRPTNDNLTVKQRILKETLNLDLLTLDERNTNHQKGISDSTTSSETSGSTIGLEMSKSSVSSAATSATSASSGRFDANGNWSGPAASDPRNIGFVMLNNRRIPFGPPAVDPSAWGPVSKYNDEEYQPLETDGPDAPFEEC